MRTGGFITEDWSLSIEDKKRGSFCTAVKILVRHDVKRGD